MVNFTLSISCNFKIDPELDSFILAERDWVFNSRIVSDEGRTLVKIDLMKYRLFVVEFCESLMRHL